MDDFEEIDFAQMSDEDLDAYLAEMREKHKQFFATAAATARPKHEKPRREIKYVDLGTREGNNLRKDLDSDKEKTNEPETGTSET